MQSRFGLCNPVSLKKFWLENTVRQGEFYSLLCNPVDSKNLPVILKLEYGKWFWKIHVSRWCTALMFYGLICAKGKKRGNTECYTAKTCSECSEQKGLAASSWPDAQLMDGSFLSAFWPKNQSTNFRLPFVGLFGECFGAFGVEFYFVLVWWWGRCGHGWLIALLLCVMFCSFFWNQLSARIFDALPRGNIGPQLFSWL